METKCITCNASLMVVDGSTSFPCPECKENINRCGKCRKIARKYKCKCGFEGP